MKNMLFYFSIVIILVSTVSCERPIDLDLDTGEQRLVIEASLEWERGTLGNEQVIKLSRSTSYYNPVRIPATGATVTITDAVGTVYTFSETEEGTYTTDMFSPELNATYKVIINDNGQIYTASETLIPVPEISRIEQERVDDGEGSFVQITPYFNDPAGVDNYYYIKMLEIEVLSLPLLFTLSDEFADGEELFYKHRDDGFYTVGSEVNVKLIGVSNRFYNYINLIIDQQNFDSGPFSIIPPPIKGNFINTTNSELYPFGYLRINEVVNKSIIVTE